MNKKLHQIYTVTDLLALQDDPDRWIVPQMIPKAGRSLVYGEGGHFKSSIVFDLCVAVASQGLLFNQLPVQLHGPVLLNTTEGSILDNKARILAHVRAHDLNPADMKLHICQQPFVLDDVLDVHELEYWLKEIKPVLTVLDPLDSFFAGDENSAKETKALRRVLDRLIDQHQTSMIVIHHKGKADNGPRGSTAWTAWADSVLFVRRADKAIPGLKETMPIVTGGVVMSFPQCHSSTTCDKKFASRTTTERTQQELSTPTTSRRFMSCLASVGH
jgi:RecA-family ATPase